MISVIQRDTASAHTTFRATVGTSAAALTASELPCTRGVGLKASPSNAGTIYVGKTGVTAGGTAATDGWPLAAGEELFIPASDPRAVFVIASDVSQALFVIVL